MLLSAKRKCESELREKMGVLKAYEVSYYGLKFIYLPIHMLYRTLSNSTLQRLMNLKKDMIETWQQSKHCKPKEIQLFLSKYNQHI